MSTRTRSCCHFWQPQKAVIPGCSQLPMVGSTQVSCLQVKGLIPTSPSSSEPYSPCPLTLALPPIADQPPYYPSLCWLLEWPSLKCLSLPLNWCIPDLTWFSLWHPALMVKAFLGLALHPWLQSVLNTWHDVSYLQVQVLWQQLQKWLTTGQININKCVSLGWQSTGKRTGRHNDGVRQDGRWYSLRLFLPIPLRLSKEGKVRLL